MRKMQQKMQFSHFFSVKLLNSLGNYEHMKLLYLCLTPTHLCYMS